MMSLTFALFTQVSGSGPLGPLVVLLFSFSICSHCQSQQIENENNNIKQKCRNLTIEVPYMGS